MPNSDDDFDVHAAKKQIAYGAVIRLQRMKNRSPSPELIDLCGSDSVDLCGSDPIDLCGSDDESNSRVNFRITNIREESAWNNHEMDMQNCDTPRYQSSSSSTSSSDDEIEEIHSNLRGTKRDNHPEPSTLNHHSASSGTKQDNHPEPSTSNANSASSGTKQDNHPEPSTSNAHSVSSGTEQDNHPEPSTSNFQSASVSGTSGASSENSVQENTQLQKLSSTIPVGTTPEKSNLKKNAQKRKSNYTPSKETDIKKKETLNRIKNKSRSQDVSNKKKRKINYYDYLPLGQPTNRVTKESSTAKNTDDVSESRLVSGLGIDIENVNKCENQTKCSVPRNPRQNADRSSPLMAEKHVSCSPIEVDKSKFKTNNANVRKSSKAERENSPAATGITNQKNKVPPVTSVNPDIKKLNSTEQNNFGKLENDFKVVKSEEVIPTKIKSESPTSIDLAEYRTEELIDSKNDILKMEEVDLNDESLTKMYLNPSITVISQKNGSSYAKKEQIKPNVSVAAIKSESRSTSPKNPNSVTSENKPKKSISPCISVKQPYLFEIPTTSNSPENRVNTSAIIENRASNSCSTKVIKIESDVNPATRNGVEKQIGKNAIKGNRAPNSCLTKVIKTESDANPAARSGLEKHIRKSAINENRAPNSCSTRVIKTESATNPATKNGLEKQISKSAIHENRTPNSCSTRVIKTESDTNPAAKNDLEKQIGKNAIDGNRASNSFLSTVIKTENDANPATSNSSEKQVNKNAINESRASNSFLPAVIKIEKDAIPETSDYLQNRINENAISGNGASNSCPTKATKTEHNNDEKNITFIDCCEKIESNDVDTKYERKANVAKIKQENNFENPNDSSQTPKYESEAKPCRVGRIKVRSSSELGINNGSFGLLEMNDTIPSNSNDSISSAFNRRSSACENTSFSEPLIQTVPNINGSAVSSHQVSGSNVQVPSASNTQPTNINQNKSEEFYNMISTLSELFTACYRNAKRKLSQKDYKKIKANLSEKFENLFIEWMQCVRKKFLATNHEMESKQIFYKVLYRTLDNVDQTISKCKEIDALLLELFCKDSIMKLFPKVWFLAVWQAVVDDKECRDAANSSISNATRISNKQPLHEKSDLRTVNASAPLRIRDTQESPSNNNQNKNQRTALAKSPAEISKTISYMNPNVMSCVPAEVNRANTQLLTQSRSFNISNVNTSMNNVVPKVVPNIPAAPSIQPSPFRSHFQNKSQPLLPKSKGSETQPPCTNFQQNLQYNSRTSRIRHSSHKSRPHIPQIQPSTQFIHQPQSTALSHQSHYQGQISGAIPQYANQVTHLVQSVPQSTSVHLHPSLAVAQHSTTSVYPSVHSRQTTSQLANFGQGLAGYQHILPQQMSSNTYFEQNQRPEPLNSIVTSQKRDPRFRNRTCGNHQYLIPQENVRYQEPSVCLRPNVTESPVVYITTATASTERQQNLPVQTTFNSPVMSQYKMIAPNNSITSSADNAASDSMKAYSVLESIKGNTESHINHRKIENVFSGGKQKMVVDDKPLSVPFVNSSQQHSSVIPENTSCSLRNTNDRLSNDRQLYEKPISVPIVQSTTTVDTHCSEKRPDNISRDNDHKIDFEKKEDAINPFTDCIELLKDFYEAINHTPSAWTY